MAMSLSEGNAAGRSPAIWIVFAIGLVGVTAATFGIRTAHDVSWIKFFDNMHWTFGTGTAAIMAWLGYRRKRSTENSTAQLCFSVGLTLYAVGQLAWDIQTAISYSVFPSPSDLFYLWLGPGLCLGLMHEIRRNARRSELAAMQLDILALAIASVTVVLALYLPRRGQTDFAALAVLTAYPATLITATCIGLAMIPALRLRNTLGLWTFLISVAVTAWSWMTWNSMALDGTTTDGSWFNISFSYSVLFMGLVVSDWNIQSSESAAWDRICEGILRLMPFQSVIAACVAVVAMSVAADVPLVSEMAIECGSVFVIVLAAISQVMSLKERDLLVVAQRETIASRALLQTVVDAVPVSVFWKDRDCRYLGCNAAFAADSGLEHSDDIIGRTDDDLHWKEQAALYQADDRLVMATGLPKLGYEEPQTRVNGHTMQLRTSKVPLKQGNDGVIGVVGVYEDITQRKQAEDQLRQSEEKYRRIVDTAFEGIVALDADGRVAFVNGRMTAMLGVAADEMLGRLMTDFIAPEEMADHCQRMENRYGGISENYERRFIHKDGHGVWTYCSATPIMDDDCIVMGSFGMFTDITERKRAEDEVQRNLAQQRALLDVYRNTPAARVSEIISLVVDKCVTLTGSGIGFVGLIGDDQQHMEAHAWSEKAMAHCPIEKPQNFALKDAGLWAEPIRQRRVITVNDYAEQNPLKKGLPEGHLCISRFMGVPIMDDGRVVAVGAVANKDDGYGESDQYTISLLLKGMWEILKRKRAEEELRTLNDELEGRVLERTAEIQEKNAELERTIKLFVGRELRMVELKERIRELEDLSHRGKEATE